MKKYIIEPINEFTYSLKITGEYASILNNMIKKYLKSSYYDTKLESIFFQLKAL
jgi:hypothetical protein